MLEPSRLSKKRLDHLEDGSRLESLLRLFHEQRRTTEFGGIGFEVNRGRRKRSRGLRRLGRGKVERIVKLGVEECRGNEVGEGMVNVDESFGNRYSL